MYSQIIKSMQYGCTLQLEVLNRARILGMNFRTEKNTSAMQAVGEQIRSKNLEKYLSLHLQANGSKTVMNMAKRI